MKNYLVALFFLWCLASLGCTNGSITKLNSSEPNSTNPGNPITTDPSVPSIDLPVADPVTAQPSLEPTQVDVLPQVDDPATEPQVVLPDSTVDTNPLDQSGDSSELDETTVTDDQESQDDDQVIEEEHVMNCARLKILKLKNKHGRYNFEAFRNAAMSLTKIEVERMVEESARGRNHQCKKVEAAIEALFSNGNLNHFRSSFRK